MNVRKLFRVKNDETAVSPVIAVILMVAITVVLAATVYVWVSGFGSSGSQAKTLSVSEISCTSGAGGNALFTVVSVSPNFASTALTVKDATTPATTLAATQISNPIAAGDTMKLTATGTLGCSDILNFVDTGSNNVVATITLHP